MAHLRKDQTEALLEALDSATSGPLEEITIVRAKLRDALRIVLESDEPWSGLITHAARLDGWHDQRRDRLLRADRPDAEADPDTLLTALWDLVTELNERRTLGD